MKLLLLPILVRIVLCQSINPPKAIIWLSKASTLPTPPPETLRSTTTTTTTELPTPPPETTPEISSTTRFLRPERKQMNKTKFFNPCPSGKPLMNEFNTPISSNRCEMRRDTGEGSELVARWYYDKHAKQCRRFLYKGIRGNANNFVTKTQCVDACETTSSIDRANPCRIGNPASHRNRSRIVCGPNDTSSCPRNYYCHFGENPETTACCETSGLTDLCLLALNVGQGKANVKRFYYNTLSKRCTEFMYRGTKGNENNFLTLEKCQDACQKWSNPCPTENFGPRRECSANSTECGVNQWCHLGGSDSTTVCCPGGECKSPCGSGEMLMTPTNEPRLCNPTSPCPQSHWCHVGITPEMTVCCSTLPNTCEMPLIKGHGNSYLTRWHFDSKQKKCIKFIYSGEGGNQNMFLTQDDCETICPVYENPCGSGKPLLVGNVPKVCNPSQRCPSTHFCHIGVDSDQNYCCPKILPNPCELGEPLLNALKEPIICGGEDSCINGYWCHVGGSPETTNCCPGTRRPCDLPLETGQGSETLERWFYDGGIQMCRTFVYKGMKGNSNNFLTKQACRQACKELNPCGYGEPLVGTDDERVLCSGGQKIDTCPRGFYCHVGSSALMTLCCPRNSEQC
ncbi:Kunitz/Bovine pancreatic trypsin inhibitor domain protein [Necator americanus]|uniref:Kunitz/Bovine pancreatic trypsin inhibitor domain protein n=1 Tax=Necator americanus TaxID=51031 RepID=W2TSF9_NECAM|nr:Kunitz/Bovine pancreatic trypsin inhibitor domain protein [Necator americanus]ETN85000.1 Kunitz/Bovine pancreatic trypsin inhibitor domain protein [Necator americanus]